MSTALSSNANDKKRSAIVIGNDGYVEAGELMSCVNDADNVAEALKRLRFKTEQWLNLTGNAMKEKVSSFISNLEPDSVAFVYFSGHGCQLDNKSYILPVDCSEINDITKYGYCCCNNIVNDVENKIPKGVCIAVFDACRSDVLKNWPNNIIPEHAVIGTGDINVKGSITAYSCKEGTVSLCGSTSRYTDCMLSHIYRRIDIAMVLRYANHELSTYYWGDETDKQESRYTDALRSPRMLILNSSVEYLGEKCVKCKTIRNNTCRPRPSTDTVWGNLHQPLHMREHKTIYAHT
jgi:hypothetical protein